MLTPDGQRKIMNAAFAVTDAFAHDSQAFVELIDEKDRDIKADSGCSGEKYEKAMLDKFPEIKP
jgi:hypothetical protein